MSNLQFRDATQEDAERLVEIYQYYVEYTAITFEWVTPTVEEFQRRMVQTMEKFPYIVAEWEDRIVGYAYANPFKERKAYEWSVETTIYLAPEIQRQGVGKKLYQVMEDILKKMNILNLNACIAYPKGEEDEYLTRNSARFHEHLGYGMVGRFHDSGYKFGRWYDMIWMEKMIGAHREHPATVISYRELDAVANGMRERYGSDR